MNGKLVFVLLALFAYQGNCLTELTLPDRNIDYIRHEHIGFSISIAKNFLDALNQCYVTFPNGVMYEAFPQYNIPFADVSFSTSVQPFTSCSIAFRNVGVEYSGTYELFSTVLHSGDNSMSLTRRKFNVVVREADFS